jgi:hypothetical protein
LSFVENVKIDDCLLQFYEKNVVATLEYVIVDVKNVFAWNEMVKLQTYSFVSVIA